MNTEPNVPPPVVRLPRGILALAVAAAGALIPAPSAAPAQDAPTPAGTEAEPARSNDLSADNGILTIQAKGFTRPEPPLFFSARAETRLDVTARSWTSRSDITFEVLQGTADVFAVGLHGEGEVTSVTGDGVLEWAVRRVLADGGVARLLEIRPSAGPDGQPRRSLSATVTAVRSDLELPVETTVLTIGPGKAVGFSSIITLAPDRSVDLRVAAAEGLVPVKPADENDRSRRFQAFGPSRLALRLVPGGAAVAPVELRDVALEGVVAPGSGSVSFILTGRAEVSAAEGGTLEVLSGHAAVTDHPADGPFRLGVAPRGGGGMAYFLEFPAAGSFPVRLAFDAGIVESADRLALDFRVPAGAVVPVGLAGLAGDVRFDPGAPVFPTRAGEQWRGFLPADGRCAMTWQRAVGAEEGKLFFASDARVETRVGAGLMRQATTIDLHLLQGKLDAVALLLEGPGEILSVEGGNILGWTVEQREGGGRALAVRLARPSTGSEQLVVRSQTPLGDFPVAVEGLRLTPEGAVRHSGFLRVVNEGAVRLEISDVAGMTQVSPEQFPGGAPPDPVRQVFVYRFPSEQHDYRINADQVLPEIGVSQIVVYEMAEADRFITARVELDIREAPVREFEVRIPEAFSSVVSFSGAEVADYVMGSEVQNASRALTFLFRQAAMGRQLVEFRIGRNTPAAAGAWPLQPLGFPEAKSVRGHVGVAVAPGFRVTPGEVTELTEIPQAYFPVQMGGLQQTFRIRNPGWTAGMVVEALDQSVQADVFHLYSLKEGVAYGSVLVNFFVVGAPVDEWRLEIPPALGNLAVDGQNVQGWRREEDVVVVGLHQPTLGAATLLVTFEQPLNVRGGLIRPGEVKTVGTQSERGFVQVVSPSQVRRDITTASDGLLELEPLELPAEYRLLTSAPSLAVYQYASRPFDLEISVEWFDPADTLDQVIDFATLESRVTGDGQVVTDALFMVKTRGRKALRLTLPEGQQPWESFVGGAPVNARTDGEETLVPLPPNLDPNTPVEVLLRLGQTAPSPRRVNVSSPTLAAPTLITTWKVTGDPGRRLIPAGSGTPELARPVLTETGFEWLQTRGWPQVLILVVLIVGGFVAARRAAAGSWRQGVAVFFFCLAMIASILFAVVAGEDRRVNRSTLEFVRPVVEAGKPVTLGLRNVAAWEAFVSWPGVVLMVVGIALAGGIGARGGRLASAAGVPAWLRDDRALARCAVIGWMLVAAGLLAQRGGAIPFFVGIALFLYAISVHPLLVRLARHRKTAAAAGSPPPPPPKGDGPGSAGSEPGSSPPPVPDLEGPGEASSAADEGAGKPPRKSRRKRAPKKSDEGGGASGGTTTLLLASLSAALAGFGGGPPAAVQGMDAPAPLVADTITQDLRIEKGRLFGNLAIEVDGREGQTLLLLNAPAILTEFQGDGLRVAKRELDGRLEYRLVVERDGPSAAQAAFELALGDPSAGFVLPTGPAAVQRVSVRIDEPGWEFGSPAAVRSEVLDGLPSGSSGARLVIGLQGEPRIHLAPMSRDLTAEEAQFFTEVANLFVPGPGVVDGRHRVTVRPSRGRISVMTFDVPDGFTVSDVRGDGVSGWRFDPEAAALRVEFSPPKVEPFALQVATQQGLGALPSESVIAPLSVVGAAGQVGMVALAFGPEAQPEKVEADGLSKVNLDDFDASLLQEVQGSTDAEGNPVPPTLHQVFRYGQEAGTLRVGVAPVAPDVRVFSQQTLSIGDERLVLAVDLTTTITRAGLFKLSFPLPPGLEVEAASGPALSHWTESSQDGTRMVTLHLAGRTIGQQAFSISLAGPAVGAQADWAVPKLGIREASRQTGQLLVVPEQGIRVREVSRNQVDPADARELSGNRPGTLAFRLLHADWALSLSLEQLDPWITAQALHEVTLREGLTRTRLGIRFHVENAAVKSVQVRLPALDPGEATTVRAAGSAVADIVGVEGDDRLWEIRFQRRVLGPTMVDIEYQRVTERPDGGESIATAELTGANQSSYWVAVRASSHLEIQVEPGAAGWQTIDWSSVPGELVDPRDRSVPALAFRTVDPEGPLSVRVQRHAVAETLRLRVSRGEFTTIVSPEGASVTRADMHVEVVEKGAMRVSLPEGAALINVFVNDQSASVVREGDAFLFNVLPLEDGGAARVSVTWGLAARGTGRTFTLAGPRLNVPLQDITWNVALPEGFTLARAEGSLDLVAQQRVKQFRLDDYRTAFLAQRSAEADDATRLLENANLWKQQGQQDKARSALSRLSRDFSLDAATNEDARVQLRELQTEQAVVGLNTRRQKLYLDNRADDPGFTKNEQLEQAAGRNPLLQGRLNYDPAKVDELLQGNTTDENSALKRIASRLVSQQLAAEPALRAIDVTLPESGELVAFRRTVQVDGSEPLELELSIVRASRVAWWAVVLILAAVGVMVVLARRWLPGRREN